MSPFILHMSKDLKPAQGILYAVLAGAVFWSVIGYIVWSCYGSR